PEGRTTKVNIERKHQTAPALSEEKAIELARMGRKIEGHFGNPQDIEWCLSDNEIFVLQSRPITTLYPVPLSADDKLHLFLSVGHPQMMTEAIKPLGISVLRTLIPLGKSSPQAESSLLLEAGGRLFFDVNQALTYPHLKERLPELLLNIDELMGRTVQEFVEREDFQAALQVGNKTEFALVKKAFPTVFSILKNILYHDDFQAIDEINQFLPIRSRKIETNYKRYPVPRKSRRFKKYCLL
ncbi:MAG TPA: PEP/pyruvate-binding domain-containing protein, partial [Negativicutes bacterium]|nr:PEP/pyruvate-binding domain-containing protein [Negativicutes bacterium]